MIYAVRGRLVHLSKQSLVLEDAAGVSWEMEISQATHRDVAAEEGETHQVYAWLHHREDIMNLYGFSRLEERRFFLLLNKVNGIGPKQSMKVLGMARPAALATAIVAEDESFLRTLPGIGEKAAKKIILSLKDALAAEDFGQAAAGDGEGAVAADLTAGGQGSRHLVQALVNMGFERRAAGRALDRVLSSAGTAGELSEGEILRQSIIELS